MLIAQVQQLVFGEVFRIQLLKQEYWKSDEPFNSHETSSARQKKKKPEKSLGKASKIALPVQTKIIYFVPGLSSTIFLCLTFTFI